MSIGNSEAQAQYGEAVIEDVHICGACKKEFTDIEDFILHKRQRCRGKTAPANTAGANTSTTRSSPAVIIQPVEVTTTPAVLTQDVITVVTSSEVSEEQPVESDGEMSALLQEEQPEKTDDIKFKADPTAEGDSQLNLSRMTQALAAVAQGQPMQVLRETFGMDQDTPTSPILTDDSPTKTSDAATTSEFVVETDADNIEQALQTTVSTAKSEGTSTHLIAGFKTAKRFPCTFLGCSFSSMYQKDLDRHTRIHTGEKPYSCYICSRAFNRADKLKVHLRTHTGNRPYKCTYCEYRASDSSSLKKHIRIHTNERPFKCQICPYASRNSSQLIVHLRTHTGDAPFQCQDCQAKFKINSDLKRHMRLHTGEKPYQCTKCDYRCSIKGNLNTHMRINHAANNLTTCSQCDFSTSSQKVLREHRKKHDTTEKPYKCAVCNYMCTSKSTLRTHKRVHSDDKPYSCNFCEYNSKQSGNVRTHMKRKHPDKLKSITKDGKPPKLTRVTTVAPAEETSTAPVPKKADSSGRIRPVCKKTFQCANCDASFVRVDSLRSHMRQHREIEREVAQTLESTALAVLQLQNPISTAIANACSKLQVDNVAQQNDPTSHTERTSPDKDKADKERQDETSGALGTDQHDAQKSPTAGSHAALTQAANNLMAFVQNNQNKAVEDNMRNSAVSVSQQVLTPSLTTVGNTLLGTTVSMSHPLLTSRDHSDNMRGSEMYRPPPVISHYNSAFVRPPNLVPQHGTIQQQHHQQHSYMPPNFHHHTDQQLHQQLQHAHMSLDLTSGRPPQDVHGLSSHQQQDEANSGKNRGNDPAMNGQANIQFILPVSPLMNPNNSGGQGPAFPSQFIIQVPTSGVNPSSSSSQGAADLRLGMSGQDVGGSHSMQHLHHSSRNTGPMSTVDMSHFRSSASDDVRSRDK